MIGLWISTGVWYLHGPFEQVFGNLNYPCVGLREVENAFAVISQVIDGIFESRWGGEQHVPEARTGIKDKIAPGRCI
jgi:hypothetical protein